MNFRQLIVFVLLAILLPTIGISQKATKGLVHFPELGQKGDEVLQLSGEWQFYYGKHLSADDMEHLSSEEKYYLASPSNWKNCVRNGQVTPVFGIATYYLKIIVDTTFISSTKEYAIRVGDITSAYQLYVNDQPVMQTGKASSDKSAFMPGYYPHIGYFNTDKDTLRMIVHASNYFYPHFSGISRPILFGQEEQISRLQIQTTAINIFLMSILAVLCFFGLWVFILYPKERSYLMISLLALIFLVKMLFDSEMTLFHLSPDFNFYTGYRIWLLCLMAVPIMYSLIKHAFPSEMNRGATLTVHIAYGIIGVAILFLPLPLVLAYLMPIIYLTIACVIYLLWVITFALIKGRKYALINFVSLVIALGCILYDLIMITNPNKVNFISQIGICIFLLTQTSIVMYQFIQAHNLSLKLMEKLERSNLTLETTVEKRTKELQITNEKLKKVNNQKNFMLATTTHDLKNSFNILTNCSNILAEDKTLTQDQLLYADMIHTASQNGYRVLENILSWARMQMTDYSGTNVIRNFSILVKKEMDTFKNQLESKSLNVRIELNDSLHFICDEEQLYSVGRNLLSNAIKFSKPGGEIVFSNKLVDDRIEIHIQDNGIGIEPQMIDTLFDNSINNKRQGTIGENGSGLGLIIVKELVESNNGSISCTSEVGKGTDFILSFPLYID